MTDRDCLLSLVLIDRVSVVRCVSCVPTLRYVAGNAKDESRSSEKARRNSLDCGLKEQKSKMLSERIQHCS